MVIVNLGFWKLAVLENSDGIAESLSAMIYGTGGGGVGETDAGYPAVVWHSFTSCSAIKS